MSLAVLIVYSIRRLLYAIPIIIGVNCLTFSLFFLVNTPDDMARLHLGNKYVTDEAIARWKHSKGLDKPLFFNSKQTTYRRFTDTLFYRKSLALFAFHFGQSEQGRDISYDIKQRIGPSLAIALPTLLFGLVINITTAMLIVLFRDTYFDQYMMGLCVAMLSISTLFYIVTGQFLFSKLLQLAPISGYLNGLEAIRFLVVPVTVGVLSGFGAGTRWYRTIFLEEMGKAYVLTAKAKGLSTVQVLFKHVLKNGLIPIITQVVAIIPLLFMGSLLMEAFFGIPGLGSYTIDAIGQQDFEIVRVMVYLGTIFYLLGLVLTDIAYSLVDPRIRL